MRAVTDGPQQGSPLVSVIIPVHNAETYLEQCLDSVLGQTLRDLEVIAVDDASGDSSPGILARYGSSDERMRVITFATNRGVSAARNAGLAAAEGRFVAFVDADDEVDTSMLEVLAASARRLDVDIVACGITVVDPGGAVIATEDFPLAAERRYGPSDMREALHGAWGAKLLWYPFRSLYSHKLISVHGLRFDEGVRKGEDSLFNLQALFHARATACVRAAPYHYRKHPSSATAKPLASESDNLERLGQRVIAFYRDHDFDHRAYADFYEQVLRSDLPTALVRLRRHPQMASEVRALLSTSTTRMALRSVRISGLGAPRSVALLLVLAKFAPPAVVTRVLTSVR